MGEMKSAIVSIAIFFGLIVPILLSVLIGSFQQQAFIKMTTEMTELVTEEGGVSTKIVNAKNALEHRGYQIHFTDAYGKAFSGTGNFGDVIQIYFTYDYQSVRGPERLETNSSVLVTRR